MSRLMDETFRYDGNGNLTNWVSGTTNWVYEWDWADRLAKVSSNGITVLENWYDAGSRRLAKKDAAYALYLWDGWESVAVLNQSGVAQEIFTRGVGIAGDIGTLVAITKLSTPAIYYAHHNHRGDVTTVRNGANTVSGYSYSAFGLQTSAFGSDLCRFKFSSKEREPTCGWSYYGYRFYAPGWQRWPNRDSLGEEGGLNLYAFVNNNPITRIDHLGLDGGDGGGTEAGQGKEFWGRLVKTAGACKQWCKRGWGAGPEKIRTGPASSAAGAGTRVVSTVAQGAEAGPGLTAIAVMSKPCNACKRCLIEACDDSGCDAICAECERVKGRLNPNVLLK